MSEFCLQHSACSFVTPTLAVTDKGKMEDATKSKTHLQHHRVCVGSSSVPGRDEARGRGGTALQKATGDNTYVNRDRAG